MSSVGKGVTSSSIGAMLQCRGFRVTNIKCDMYVNIDAGTIRPTEHGEVFVGKDGVEADQDLGNYERFTGNPMSRVNYVTTGQVYQEVIRRERNLEFDGEDVEVVPDIPNEIIRRIQLCQKTNRAEITVIELGGTVGEYQVLLFLEAARVMKMQKPSDVAFVLVSYLPLPRHIGEMKTKPTQYAVRSLNAAGLQADFIIARGEQELDNRRREKLAHVCNLRDGTVVAAPDVDSIYRVPLQFHEQGFDDRLLAMLGLRSKMSNFAEWKKLDSTIRSLKRSVKIGVVGKYFGTGDFTLADSYISVIEAAKHACWANHVAPELIWIDSEDYEKNPRATRELSNYDGIIVPGGFGTRGIEGVIRAIQYIREHEIPYLGLCYGMQLAAVEFARNVVGHKKAHTVEIDSHTPDPIITANPFQRNNIKTKNYGASMRLGSYPCDLAPNSHARRAYGVASVSERHRHRYEFNPAYQEVLSRHGVVFSGICPENQLVEIMEIPKHPWFVGTQFHPEFQSRPNDPHPLFRDFVAAAKKRSRKRSR